MAALKKDGELLTRSFKKGEVLTAARLDALRRASARNSGFELSGGNGIQTSGGSSSRTVQGTFIWAQLTDINTSTGSYSWEEQRLKTDGTFEDAPNGRTGTKDGANQAFDPDGIDSVETDRVVPLVRGLDFWLILTQGTALRLGKIATGQTLSAGGTATADVWEWNGSAFADSGDNFTVRDWLLSSGQTIAAGKKIIAMFINSVWIVLAAECA